MSILVELDENGKMIMTENLRDFLMENFAEEMTKLNAKIDRYQKKIVIVSQENAAINKRLDGLKLLR